jgi:hypothetical protein
MLSAIYNYVFGYVKVKCDNCNRELVMKNDKFLNSGNISCSHGCTFELYNKFEKERELNRIKEIEK